MAFLGETFSIDKLPERQGGGFEPLPDGWYNARVRAAEVKNTKSGSGVYMSIRYDILGPTHQGRTVFGTSTVRNANPEAERIGREQLRQMFEAMGVNNVEDSDQLLGANCQIKVKLRDDPTYGPGNQVTGWKKMANSASTAPAQDSKSTPPWMKK